MAIILPANDIGRAGRPDPPSATHPEAAPYQFNTNINPGQHNKLFSQSACGCAIIHGGFLSAVFCRPVLYGFHRREATSFSGSAYFTARVEWHGILAGIARGVHPNPMRISRIPAESGKALEPR